MYVKKVDPVIILRDLIVISTC